MSSTLLRNMREKDLRKAIGYHMKKSQSLNDPKQKGLSVDQTRVNYLEELSELKSFGGKSFSATMMVGLQSICCRFFGECWLSFNLLIVYDVYLFNRPAASGQGVDGDLVGGGALRRESGGQPQTEHPVDPHRVQQHHTHRAAA